MASVSESSGTAPALIHAAPVPIESRHGDLLAIGFGTTVAMWAAGYLSRLPRTSDPGQPVEVYVPAGVLVAPLVLCVLGGGYVAGRYTSRGWLGGLSVGLISSVLNLLVLGSLLGGPHPNSIAPNMLAWVPAWFGFAAVLGAVGGAIGATRRWQGAPVNWTGALAKVAVAATLLLLIAGGLVTSKEAGLAVVDWPNSFGYNMFLYPLSRMSGGIYYEHAHRLFGSLVGLTVLVLAVHLWLNDPRRWLKLLALAALAAVIVQGILGGLRVTGHFTWSDDPAHVAPSTLLAVIHGIFGQVVFGLIVAMAVLVSTTWFATQPAPDSPRRRTDQTLTAALVVMLIAQLMVGAFQRHMTYGLLLHIAVATIVVIWSVVTGLRAWGFYPRFAPLSRLGATLALTTVLQVLLGFLSLIAVGLRFDPFQPADPAQVLAPPGGMEVVVTTAHQAVGAVMLALAVALALWVRREPLADWRAKGFSPTG